MGISQLPSTPVPTAKGDLIVGTATGAARLPVGTTANQTLLVDSTTTTGLKYGSPNRSWTLTVPQFTSPTSGQAEPMNGSPTTKIIFGGSTYAYTTSTYINYSTDKINWNFQQFNTSNSSRAIATNGTIWVIAADNNTLYSGTPGGTWTARTTNLDGTSGVRNVIWQPSYNLFILTGGGNATPWNCISTSPDGITWTKRFNIGASLTTNNIAFNTSGMTVTGTNNATQNLVYTSNGTSWATVDANGGTTLGSVGLAWLPTAGRFIALASNRYSQTPANMATAWGTSPATYYNTFNTVFMSNNSTVQFPEYDSVRGVWYFTMINLTSTGASGNTAYGANFLGTVSDTQLARFYFDASNNYWNHKLIALEPTPISTLNSAGASQGVLSLANNTLFFVTNLGAGHAIHYSDL